MALGMGLESGISAPAYDPVQETPTQVTETDYSTQSAEKSVLDRQSEQQAQAIEAFMGALHYEALGETAAAMDAFQRTLDIMPGEVELAIRVARSLIRAGDVDRAIDILKNAAAARPDDCRVPLVLADIYWRVLRKTDLAVRFAAQAHQTRPDDPTALGAYYSILKATGKTEEAERLLVKSERLKSDNPFFWLRLVELISATTIDLSNEIEPEALERLNGHVEKAVELGPKNFSVLSASADYYVVTRQTEMAIPLYEAAARLAPEDSIIREKLSRALISVERRQEAIPVLEQLLALNPMRVGIYELLGSLYQELGEIEKAADVFERSISLNASDPVTHRNAAALMRQLGKYERAVEILDSAKGLFRNRPELLVDLAISLSLAKRHIEALATMEGFFTYAESSAPELLSYDLLYLTGGLAYQAKELDKAATYYKKAIEADPDAAAGAYNDLGYMWLEQDKNIDEAGVLIMRAVEMDPANGAFLDSLGWYYYKVGDYKRALSYLERAAENAPPEESEARDEFLGVIYDHLGDTHFQLGNSEKALSYWKKALSHNPEQAAVADKIEREQKRLTSLSPQPEPLQRSTEQALP